MEIDEIHWNEQRFHVWKCAFPCFQNGHLQKAQYGVYIYAWRSLECGVQRKLNCNGFLMLLRSRRRVAGVANIENHWKYNMFLGEKGVRIDFWQLFRFGAVSWWFFDPGNHLLHSKMNQRRFPISRHARTHWITVVTIGFACRFWFLEKSEG